MRDVIGLDPPRGTARAAVLDASGELVQECSLRATESGLRRFFAGQAICLMVIETWGSSAWVQQLAEEAGHEVLVASSRRVTLISEASRKTGSRSRRSTT
jgi:hypothetical protein